MPAPGGGESGPVPPMSRIPASLSWSGVTARRMDRHALTEPAPDLGPAEVAGVLTEAIMGRTGRWAGEATMEAFGGRWPRGHGGQAHAGAGHRDGRPARLSQERGRQPPDRIARPGPGSHPREPVGHEAMLAEP